jgi:type IV secretion system protein VirB10
MADEEQLQARLARMQKPAAAPRLWRRLAMPAAMLGTGLVGGGYIATAVPKDAPSPPSMQTSEVREFQDDSGLAGFTVTESEPLETASAVGTRAWPEGDALSRNS